MYCKQCGKVIDENLKYCPFCGAEQSEQIKQTFVSPSYSTPVPKKSKPNTNAIVGFVIALISLFLNFAGLVGIAAVIVSVIGLIKVDDCNGNGKSMSIVGIVIGAVSILYGLISLFSL